MTDNPPPAPASPTSLGLLILPGIFGLVGVVVGGLLQYYFGYSLEAEKQRMQIQLSAYADFAKAQASLQRAELQTKSRKAADVDDANLKIRDAALRIVVFSPAEVVEAVAAFTRDHHPPECGAITPQSDIDAYKKMRRQIRGDGISDDDIVMALFGCKRKAAATPG